MREELFYEFQKLEPTVSLQQFITKTVTENEKEDFSDYSSVSQYDDLVWILDKYYPRLNIDPSKRKYNFKNIKSIQMKLEIKEYIFSRVLLKLSLEDLNKCFWVLRDFFNNLYNEFEIENCNEIKEKHIEHYYLALKQANITEKTICFRWNTIRNFLARNNNVTLARIMNLYNMEYPQYVKSEEKYISEYVANQFDRIMKNIDIEIPLHCRLLYWLLRLYPGRCTETISTPIECIKPYKDDIHVFSTQVFKTGGGSENGTPKLLLIDTAEETQKFLFNLIIKQREVAREIYKQNPLLGDFLFSCHRSRYQKSKEAYMYDKNPILYKTSYFNDFLDRIQARFNIKEENGEPADISSHMFRHNATTDRVESKLFRPIDLRPMTLHANEEMFNKAYHHKSPNKIIKQSEDIREYITGETVLFSGKVIGSKNDKAFDFFLKNPFAFSLNNMGICADVRSCTKNKLECLGCDYFIPNCDDLDYFENQLEEWKNKFNIAQKLKNEYLKSNAEYNISLFEKVINKIKKTIGSAT